jgi:hypothetical protein
MAETTKTLQDFINEIGDPKEAYKAYVAYLAQQPNPTHFNIK